MRALAFLFLAAAALPAQVFEAASIKPGDQNASEWKFGETENGFNATNSPVRDLILYAYDVKDYQVSGAPRWSETARYTVVAKLENMPKAPQHGSESDPRIMAAMRALLADRFHLQIHREKKAVPGYALAAWKGPLKMKKVEPGDSSWTMSGGKAAFHRSSLPDLAEGLARILGRPVIDESGIAGAYDVELRWTTDSGTDGSPSIFGALQDLGLKLEGKKVPVDLIVIDRIEKPTPN